MAMRGVARTMKTVAGTMRPGDWIRENIQGVKGVFGAHLLMNPLQYLCRVLLGAQAQAVLIWGFQYRNAQAVGGGIILFLAGMMAMALCSAVDAVLRARVECGVRLRQRQKLLRSILYRKDRGDNGNPAHTAKQASGGDSPHNGRPSHSAGLQEILITDVENIVEFFGIQINNLMTPLVVSAVSLAAVAVKSGIIAVIVFLSMVLTAAINLYFLPRLHAQFRQVREAENGLNVRYADTILGSAVIRVFSCQKYYLGEIGRNIQGVLWEQTKEVKIRFMQGLALNLLSFSSGTVPFVAGAVLAVRGKLELSTVVYISQLSGSLLWFINTFSSTAAGMQKTRISRERIEAVLAGGETQEAEDRARTDGGIVADSRCAVRLEHLNVELSGRQILKDISLEIPGGACVAFVGESGCGKTTIFKALQDFVPCQGTIRLFGRDADSLEERTRYGLMSLVSQDVGLINGTIFENIFIGDQTASRRQVEEAAGLALVDRFTGGLEAGLDTEAGENGSMLSGGERQRIALARGFLKAAPILLLDEVTSALDPETERGVVCAVESLRGRHTILVIAQKLNTIRSADRIYCMKDGMIVGQGTHEELMGSCGEYRRLVESASV